MYFSRYILCELIQILCEIKSDPSKNNRPSIVPSRIIFREPTHLRFVTCSLRFSFGSSRPLSVHPLKESLLHEQAGPPFSRSSFYSWNSLWRDFTSPHEKKKEKKRRNGGALSRFKSVVRQVTVSGFCASRERQKRKRKREKGRLHYLLRFRTRLFDPIGSAYSRFM